MSNHTKVLCFPLSLYNFLLVISVFTKLLHVAHSRTFAGDILVLKDLKNGLDQNSIAPGSCISSWDFSIDPCDHLFTKRFTCGFRCDRVVSGSFRVTEIALDQASYAGSLRSTGWNLPYLQTLDLSGNSFHGPVPGSLSKLTGLRRLSLSMNSLTGSLPGSLGSLFLLEELYLDNNHIHGPIPPSFNGLVSLKRLELQQNNFSGEIPDLGSLKNLYYLDVLDLSHNHLGGSMSSVLFDHPSLQQVTLSHNKFSSLELHKNVGVNSKLIALDLSYNELRGLLPAFMGSMSELSVLSLEHNKFTGMISSQYALKVAFPGPGMAPFQRLLLGGNYLFGPIPGPLMGLKEGSVNVSLVDNCLYQCPDLFFFCQGAGQKSVVDCKSFGPYIP